MSTDPRIKVIKLAERKRRAKARVKQGRAAAAARRPEQDSERDATDAVTGWVDELRKQKQQSAGALSDFNNLFEDPS